MNKVNYKIIVYSLLHFVVDAICGLVVFSKFYNGDNTQIIYVFIAYNSFAFLYQPLVGYIVDKMNKEKIMLLISSCLLILSLLVPLPFYIGAIILGIGNALFHVIGGQYTLINKSNSLTYQGLFVSLGAVGLALGCYFYDKVMKYILLASLILLILIICIVKFKDTKEPEQEIKTINITKKNLAILVTLLCLAVFIRALINKEFTFTWNVDQYTILAIAITTCLGKIIGGILADVIGINFTMAVSTILSILCLCVSNTYIELNLLGILCFNFSMPITLYLINKLLPGKEGLSFGLLAFALFPGYLLGMINYPYWARVIQIMIFTILSYLLVTNVNKKEIDYGIIK